MLEVNCGNGAFLEFLWHCGFDIHASEQDPELRIRAQNRAVPQLEVYASPPDDLPFENDSFDWVIIHLASNQPDSLLSCLQEGSRLARRGLLATFWNSASLPALAWNAGNRKSWSDNAVSWWRVFKILHNLRMGRLATFSTLMAPTCYWKKQWKIGGTSTLPLGAWCLVRMDMAPLAPVTPLPLRVGAALGRQQPALEPFNNEIIHNQKQTKNTGPALKKILDNKQHL